MAKEIGEFLRLQLAGSRRSTSSRSKINLKSTIYLLVRNKHGEVFTNPVKVYRTWGSFRHQVEEDGRLGDSVFVGLPSQREALAACVEAGFDWPSSIEG